MANPQHDLAAVRETLERVEGCSNRARMVGLVSILDQQGPDIAVAEWRRRQQQAATEALRNAPKDEG